MALRDVDDHLPLDRLHGFIHLPLEGLLLLVAHKGPHAQKKLAKDLKTVVARKLFRKLVDNALALPQSVVRLEANFSILLAAELRHVGGLDELAKSVFDFRRSHVDKP